MRLHRFIGDFDLNQKTLTISDSELINQWRNVLRLKSGDAVILSDGSGNEARAILLDGDKKSMQVELEEVSTPEREPKKSVTLYVAVLKRENFELVVQKATEIGISRIVPLLTERTVKTGVNIERLEKIIKEASEQSGRTTIPKLSQAMSFEEAVSSVDPKTAVLFDLSGSAFEAKSKQQEANSSFFIGPEGGFTEGEVAQAKESGCSIASLGNLTLRGETAAIVVSYLATL